MNVWMNFSYLVASLCFILTLQQLSSPKTARRGVLLGVIGMTAAVVGTALLHPDIRSYTWIVSWAPRWARRCPSSR
jgi:H+-translocating NAD(P) transhydrogenase subunit beta